jgi:hypothetical protein
MLKNLRKTWENLAPDEELPFSDEEALLGDNLRGTNMWCSVFQGYIQQCIHDRGWYWNIEQLQAYSKAGVWAETDGDPYYCIKETDAYREVLLTAYLKTLTAKREIPSNSTWQHFKGGSVKVLCSAQENSVASIDEYKDAVFHGQFCVEEYPTQKVSLLKNQDRWFYVSEHLIISGDRVFYIHDDVGYARLTRSFLGLVGPEHPEQEGLLRFVEVKA